MTAQIICLYREEANRPAVTDHQTVPPREMYCCDMDRPEWPNCARCPLYIPLTAMEPD